MRTTTIPVVCSRLALAEVATLDTHEATIAAGLSTFVEVGLALRAIREGKLYRQDYETFEAYCAERWELARNRAYQLIGAAAVVSNLTDDVQNFRHRESHVTPLTRLKPDAQRAAWQEAIQTAPGGQVTAAHVQAVVAQICPPRARRPQRWCIEDDVERFYTLFDQCWGHWATEDARRRMLTTLQNLIALLTDPEDATTEGTPHDPC